MPPSDTVRQEIQSAYRSWLASKDLKPRVGQRQMIAAVANSLAQVGVQSQAPICVVEAGTGTGKTLAYLLASIPVAKEKEKNIVLATATVALQEQIVFKDLPDLLSHSDLSFSFALAKGRGRYLCLSKLDLALEGNQSDTSALYPDEIRVQNDPEAVKIYHSMADAVAAAEWDGDRDNWPDEVVDQHWSSVAANFTQCTGRRCSNISACYFFKAREDLQQADVVVANHDLVLADLALGGGAILPDPQDTIYIFDEGHHLPNKTLQHFTHFSRLRANRSWLEQLSKSLNKSRKLLPTEMGAQHWFKQIAGQIDGADKELGELLQHVETLFESVEDEYQKSYRFKNAHIPEPIVESCKRLEKIYSIFLTSIAHIVEILEDMMELGGSQRSVGETLYPVFSAAQNRGENSLSLWRAYARASKNTMPDAKWMKLVEASGQYDYELFSSPILASENLQSALWENCAAAVVTSATLTALNSFDHYKRNSGIGEDAFFTVVPSGFDYANAGVFVVPQMSCQPSQVEEHTDFIADALPTNLVDCMGALVLFSSRRQMEAVCEQLDVVFRSRVLMQGERSKQVLIAEHKQRIDGGEQSVLFGLASFAEGLDLPGDYCSHVVIAKLPFAVPDDPIAEALAEWIESSGGNAFMDVSVPEASQRLLQAAGRLLRSESDRGTITLFDRRIVDKRYGKAMLAALPPYRLQLNA